MTDFSDLKAGDKVGLWVSGWAPPRIETVTRTTPTRIVIDDKQFQKKNGSMIGGGSWRLLTIADAEERIASRKKEENENNRNRIMREVKSLYRISNTEIPATLRRIADEIDGDKKDD